MAQDPNQVQQADGKKVAKTVEEISNVINLSAQAAEEQKKAKQPVVIETCMLCEMGLKPEDIHFYNIALLKKFMSVRGKIIPRTKTGLCAAHQRAVTRAIKRARYLALLPYVNVGI